MGRFSRFNKQRAKIIKSPYLPIATYASETWTLALRHTIDLKCGVIKGCSPYDS